MSDKSTTDEKSADATPVANSVKQEPRMQYLHSYSFVFESPNWFVNLLLVAVTLFIPAIGPIVAAGYQWDIVESMHRFPGRRYPDFDFGRFMEYLVRGVWAFLVNMLAGFIQVPINLVAVYGGMFAMFGVIAMAPQGEEGLYAAIGATVIVPIALLLMIGTPVLIGFITMPLIMKATLSQDPAGLVDFKFLRGFLRLVWKEMFLELLWMSVTAPIVTLLGVLLCGIGIFPAWSLWLLADSHTNWQIYQIYLARGGEPIELKPLPAPQPQPVYQQGPTAEGGSEHAGFFEDDPNTPPQRQSPPGDWQ